MLRLTDISELLPPPEDVAESADCFSLASWEDAAQQLQQQVPRLLGTKQQVRYLPWTYGNAVSFSRNAVISNLATADELGLCYGQSTYMLLHLCCCAYSWGAQQTQLHTGTIIELTNCLQVLLTMVQLQQYNVAYQLLLPLQQQLAAHGFTMAALAPLLLQQPPRLGADDESADLAAVLSRRLFAVRPECVAAAAAGAPGEKSSNAAVAGQLLPQLPQQLAVSIVHGLVAAQQQLEQIMQAQQQELPGWLGHLESLQETCAPAQQQQQQQQQQQHQPQCQQTVQRLGQDSAVSDSVRAGQLSLHLQQQRVQQHAAAAAVTCSKRHLLHSDDACGAAAHGSNDDSQLHDGKRHKGHQRLGAAAQVEVEAQRAAAPAAAAAAAAQSQDEAADFTMTSLEDLLPPLPASPSAAAAAAEAAAQTDLTPAPVAAAAGSGVTGLADVPAAARVPVTGAFAAAAAATAAATHHAEEQHAVPAAPQFGAPGDANSAQAVETATAAAAAVEEIVTAQAAAAAATATAGEVANDATPPLPAEALLPRYPPAAESPPPPLPTEELPTAAAAAAEATIPDDYAWVGGYLQWQQQQQGLGRCQTAVAGSSSLAAKGLDSSWAGVGAQIAAAVTGDSSKIESAAGVTSVDVAIAADAAAGVGWPDVKKHAVQLCDKQQQGVPGFEQVEQQQQQQRQLADSKSDMSPSEEELGLAAAVLHSSAQFPQQQQQQQVIADKDLVRSLSEDLELPASVLLTGAQHLQQQHNGGANRAAAAAVSSSSASSRSLPQQSDSNSQILPAIQQQQQAAATSQPAAAITPAAGCFTAAQQEIALVAEAAAALLKQQQIIRNEYARASSAPAAVNIASYINFCRCWWTAAKGQQGLAIRLGGSAPAAAAVLQRWPQVFLLQDSSSRRPDTTILQLQRGGVLWLMTAEASQPILRAYRDGIVRAARKADATAPAGQRRGVDLAHAADPGHGIYMTPLVQPFRQLFAQMRQFLDAVGVLTELKVVTVSKGKQQLVPKQPQPMQQPQHMQQQEIGDRLQHQTAATARSLAEGGADERMASVFGRLQEHSPDVRNAAAQQQQQQQYLQEGDLEEGEWHQQQDEVMFGSSIEAEMHSSSNLEGQDPSAAAAAAWVLGEAVVDAGDDVAGAAVHSSAEDANHATAGRPAAAAAAAGYIGLQDEEGGADDEQMQQVLEAVSVLQTQGAFKYAVPLRTVMDSCSCANGDDRKLFYRVGGNKAAAVAWLHSWPQVFRVQQVPLNPPGAGGVTSCFMVQLQQGAVEWLLRTQPFKRQLAEYRVGLLAGVQEAAAAAAPGERRGVEIGKVGNITGSGYMTTGLLPYRQVRLHEGFPITSICPISDRSGCES
jgi:hypothetical protein